MDTATKARFVDLTDATWAAAKSAAALRGLTMRQWLTEAIEAQVEREDRKRAAK